MQQVQAACAAAQCRQQTTAAAKRRHSPDTQVPRATKPTTMLPGHCSGWQLRRRALVLAWRRISAASCKQPLLVRACPPQTTTVSATRPAATLWRHASREPGKL